MISLILHKFCLNLISIYLFYGYYFFFNFYFYEPLYDHVHFSYDFISSLSLHYESLIPFKTKCISFEWCRVVWKSYIGHTTLCDDILFMCASLSSIFLYVLWVPIVYMLAFSIFAYRWVNANKGVEFVAVTCLAADFTIISIALTQLERVRVSYNNKIVMSALRLSLLTFCH